VSANITQSVTQNVLLNLALSPIVSLGFVNMAAAQSFGILLDNAVSAEKNSQIIQNAAVSQCCVAMIAAGLAGAAK